VENNIATKIADQIQAKVTAEEQARLKKVRPVNPKALDAYFEARYHLDQSSKVDLYYGKKAMHDAEVSKAVSYLDLAVQLDPSYVSAYLAYPDALDEAWSPALLQRTKAALQKALEVDESNGQAHIAFANLLMRYEYEWAVAAREIRRAIELNPNSAEAHFQYAEYLDNIEGIEDAPEAKKERELAQALDPVHDYYASFGVGPVNFRMGMPVDEERRILEEKAPNEPDLLGSLGKDYAIAGRYEESVEMWERCLTLKGWHDFVRVLKRANAQRGPRRALEEWMRAGEEYSKSHDDLPVFVMAFTYTSLGDKDRAFAWLSKAVEQRNWCIVYLKTDTVWDPLRSDPRFMELLHRVGLPT
jgi:tetratricopeptide (TPR) repeat protein